MLPSALLEVAATPRPPAGVDRRYRSQQVLGASPMQLVLMLYDLAILGCETRDAQRAGGAIAELIGGLNFDYDEIATGLFRLYEYCHWEIRRAGYEAAAEVLRDLRRAWQDGLAARRPA